MDAAERALLDETVGDALAGAASAGAPGAADAALAHLGWWDMLAAEPRVALEVVFAALGRANAAAGVLDDVVVGALGLAPRPDLAVLLPPFGSAGAPGARDGARWTASGITTRRVVEAGEVVVVAVSGDATEVTVVPIASAVVAPVGGIDPEGGYHAVRVDHETPAAEPRQPGAWDAAVAAGRIALGHQVLGATRSMLDLARTHALGREQFGRPIARFQAVRHRLAEALVAIEALEASLAAAYDDGSPLAAALAHVVAGRAARDVAARCQQVLGGIGFTTDHPFHRYLKRTMALEGIFGAADDVARDVGRHLLATRHVPTLIEL